MKFRPTTGDTMETYQKPLTQRQTDVLIAKLVALRPAEFAYVVRAATQDRHAAAGRKD